MTKFRVIMLVPSKELGDVLAANVDYFPTAEVVMDIPHYKNKPRKTKKPLNPNRDYKAIGAKGGANRGKVTEALVNLLKEAPKNTITMTEAKKKLTAMGFAGDGVYSLRTRLVDQKIITKDGNQMTLVKA